MHSPETRPSLIVRLGGAEDQSAWWAFVEAYEPFLKHLVARQGTPPSHVADVTQQVLIAIARSVNGFRDDGRDASFRRWVHRVSRNTVIKYMARQRRQISGQGGTDALLQLDQQPAVEDPVLDNQYQHEMIVWAASKVQSEFSASSWTAFWGTMIEGRSVAALAEELSVSPGSIYMSRTRILRRIRLLIDEVMK
ncbi:sigma-70 family RNA polymerase sigma factor [Rhodopirellula sp. JC740]|uniref:Sigma-70 family RNA polymerase sigma factor n=1 Tax=Rhodopirellula halodulae TaxID=2894198 RepID=A0ABS8NK68_9BACT|nr:sigma-70 family RNA polymerase sigma factor [Rhodopirellula sp. JC740]MCC9643794.1 sigma-70 family RNA polymerase sigma factor [Rhodopirellula sp. JC740]